MKRILIGAAGFLMLLVVAALVIPFFLPKDAIKRQIVTQMESATGWRLRLDGPVGLSLLPSFSLSARDVGLSGEAGADGVEFAKVAEINFGLSLSALVGGTARITGITLKEPQILLETDSEGRTSWAPRRTLSDLIAESLDDDGTAAGGGALPPAPDAEREDAPASSVPAKEAGEGLAAVLRRVRIDELTIVDGSLRFADRRTGSSATIEAINTSFYLPAPEEPASLEGSLMWRSKTFEIEAEVGAPLALAENKSSEVTAEIVGGFGSATVSGTVAVEPLAGALRIGISGDSLDEALATFDVAANGLNGLGAYSLAATTELSPNEVRLEDLSVEAGGSTLTGRVVADIRQAEPVVAASLALDTLDLTRFGAPAGDPAMARVEAVALDLSLDGLSAPARASGGLTWNGERFQVQATAAPEPLMAGEPARSTFLLPVVM